MFGRAAQLSYFFLFSLFPLLFFLTALFGLLAAGAELREGMFNYLGAVVPPSAYALINDTLEEILQESSRAKLSFGLIATIWTASYGFGAVISTLNAAYGVEETRPWWKAKLIATGLTIALIVLIISALILLLYGRNIGLYLSAQLGLGAAFAALWSILRWLVALAFVLLTFALIYYFAPNVEEIKWQWIAPGTLLGLALWLVVSFGFRTYLNTYSATYGSLGAVMILLLWLYLTGAAILVGGELNAVIEDAAAKAGEPEAKEHGERRPSDKERMQAE